MSKKTYERISISFPLDLLAIIRKQAEKHERSFNGEVIWILRQALTQDQKEKEIKK